MYYSVIGMIAIVIHLIMNHEFFKIDKNRDVVNRAFKNYALASLMYFISDAFWGIFNTLKLSTLLYVDTIIYYISMALTIAFLCDYVTKYLQLSSGFGKFIRRFGQIFAGLEIVLLVINHFVHIFFWIYPDGIYREQRIHYLQHYSGSHCRTEKKDCKVSFSHLIHGTDHDNTCLDS